MIQHAPKAALLAMLVSIVTGSQALSANEAVVLTGVYSNLPEIVNLNDKAEVSRYLEANFDVLPNEIISALRTIIDSPAGTEFSTSGFDPVMRDSPMCMVD